MQVWIVGLGNPGPRYTETRHNAGFWFVDQLAETLGASFRKPWFRPFLSATVKTPEGELVLIKPLVFMNRSGEALRSLASSGRLQPESLLVVFDQMDLPPGRVRLKTRGSSAGHNGLKSIDEALNSTEYARLAIGIGRPPGDVVAHVLGEPGAEDRRAVQDAVKRTVSVVSAHWPKGWEALIHGINQGLGGAGKSSAETTFSVG